MDPYLHTIIAVAMLYCFYLCGRLVGQKEGAMEVWGVLLEAFNASRIELNEDEGTVNVTDFEGITRKVN